MILNTWDVTNGTVSNGSVNPHKILHGLFADKRNVKSATHASKLPTEKFTMGYNPMDFQFTTQHVV